MTCILGRDPARCRRPVTMWPPLFRQLWEVSLLPGDILEPGGARAQYSPISNRNVARSFGHFLTWLDQTGQLQPELPLAAQLTRPVAMAWLATLQGHNNSTATQLSRLEELYQAALVIGLGADWSWIRRLASRVRAHHQPARAKRPRMVSSAELYNLGTQLMAAPATSTPRQQATRYRDGLLIALLAARPLRRRNLAGLELERTLRRREDGSWWIVLPEAETKTGVALEMPWPEALVPALDTWLATYRPILAAATGRWHRPAGPALWVSADGSPMTEMALYDRIMAATKAAFGHGINPHLFRDCAVTSIAIEAPADIGIAGPMLGHRSRRTAEQYYNQAQSITASRRLQDVLLAIAEGAIS